MHLHNDEDVLEVRADVLGGERQGARLLEDDGHDVIPNVPLPQKLCREGNTQSDIQYSNIYTTYSSPLRKDQRQAEPFGDSKGLEHIDSSVSQAEDSQNRNLNIQGHQREREHGTWEGSGLPSAKSLAIPFTYKSTSILSIFVQLFLSSESSTLVLNILVRYAMV